MTPTMDDALAALRASFGYPAFRRGQDTVIASVLQGRDTLAVLPTGGGKSLCYQIPALVLPRPTLVISPLISLMQDQVAALCRRGIPAAFINSTLTHEQIEARIAATCAGAVRLLYVAPERFGHGQSAQRLAAAGISLLAVDEAHCISEWGHDFRPSYGRLREVRLTLNSPPTVALTATATPRVQRDIIVSLQLDTPTRVVTGFDRTNLNYHVQRVRNGLEREARLTALVRRVEQVTVVYAPTRRNVEHLTGLLRHAGVPAVGYHAGLGERRRHQVQQRFMDGSSRVIVATNAFGMGIDKPDVRLVVHHAMPGTLEAYYQEAGRGGRDGEAAASILFHARGDRHTHEYFLSARLPDRVVALRVIRRVVAAVRAGGTLHGDPKQHPGILDRSTPHPQVNTIVDMLIRNGILVRVPSQDRVTTLRLLATPQRVRSLAERGTVTHAQMSALRWLWRHAGTRLQDGVALSLEALVGNARQYWQLNDALSALQRAGVLLYSAQQERWTLGREGTPGDFLRELHWEAVDRRRTAERAKLDAMQGYAETRSCRRALVLRYFGDGKAPGSCGACDNCGADVILGARQLRISDVC